MSTVESKNASGSTLSRSVRLTPRPSRTRPYMTSAESGRINWNSTGVGGEAGGEAGGE